MSSAAGATETKLVVNFDHGVLQLMREAKHLQLMGFAIPNSAKTVLLLEDKLKGYHARIAHTLEVYHRVVAQVPAEIQILLSPHLQDLQRTLQPAVTTMTWTSMNIESFLQELQGELARFESLVTQLNNVIANRVQKNLEFVSSMNTLDIPPRADLLAA